MRPRQRLGAEVGVGGLALLLLGAAEAGCYHAGNDALARSAQASFQEAGIGTELDAELALSKEMQQADLKAVRRELEAERDLAVAVLLDSTWGPPGSVIGAAPAKKAAKAPQGGRPRPVLRGRAAAARASIARRRPAPASSLAALPTTAPLATPEAAPDPCEVSGAGNWLSGSVMCAIARQLARVAGRPARGEPGELSRVLLEVRATAAAVEARAEQVATDERLVRRMLPAAESESVGCPVAGPPSDALLKAHPDAPRLKTLFDLFARDCARLQASRAELAAVPLEGGLLLAAQRELDQERDTIEAGRAEAQALTASYDAARARYARPAQQGGALRKDLDEARESLRLLSVSAVDPKGQLTNRYARLAEARLRYDGVTGALDGLLAGTPETGTELAVVVRTQAELDALLADQALVLLEAERLRGEAAVLKVQVEHAERRLKLAAARRRALLDQLSELLDAQAAAEQAIGRCAVASGEHVGEHVGDTLLRVPVADRACRGKVAETLLHFANAYTLGELRARLASRAIDGDLQDEAIEASAAAMKVWQQVLAVPIEALVRRHAAGVKPEEVARLVFQAVGAAALVGIAVVR